ncbi:MAG: methyltransferase domain-containing protein [Desulfobacteria bacterium]
MMPKKTPPARRSEELFFNLWKFYPAKRLRRRAFQTIAAPVLAGRTLDVGGGLGPYRKYLSGVSYFSIEINSLLCPDLVGSALALPSLTNSIDAILLNDVLEHLPDPAAAIREAFRSLRPGGKVFATTPFLWNLHYEPHDYYRFTGYALRYLFEKEGFVVSRVEPMGRVFSYLATRLAEKWFNLATKLFFFLPKRARRYASFPLVAPVNLFLCATAVLFDLTNRRDVFFFALLAEKPHPE